MYNFPKPSGHNNGGLIQFWFVPVAWVLSVPADINSAIFGNIVLAAGRNFLTGYATFGKLSYKEPDDDSAHGTLYNQGLSGKCPCDNPVLTDLFRIMKYDNRYLLIYKDVNDNFKLAGSLAEPLRFSYELKKGSAFGDYNGYEYSFACKSTKPSLFYHGTFETDTDSFDNSFASKVQALPEAEKQKINKLIGASIEHTFILPHGFNYCVFNPVSESFIGDIELIENADQVLSIERVIRLPAEIPVYDPSLPTYTHSWAPLESPYQVNELDHIKITVLKTDDELPATVKFKVHFKTQKAPEMNYNRFEFEHSQRILLKHNYTDNTVEIIDLDKVNEANYVGAGVFTDPIVLGTVTVPFVTGTTKFERHIYNARKREAWFIYHVGATAAITCLDVDPDSPTFMEFWDPFRTVLNGVHTFAGANRTMTVPVWLPGDDETKDRLLFCAGDYTCVADYPYTQSRRLIDFFTPNGYFSSMVNGYQGYYCPYRHKLMLAQSPVITQLNPDTLVAEAATRVDSNSKFMKYSPDSGHIYANFGGSGGGVSLLLAHKFLAQTGIPMWASVSNAASLSIAEGMCFVGRHNNNNYFHFYDRTMFWQTMLETAVAKPNPDVNEVGTRDVVYSKRCNVVVFQGQNSGNQSTGVRRIHFLNPKTKTMWGYHEGGNMDARSSTPASLNKQMSINSLYY